MKKEKLPFYRGITILKGGITFQEGEIDFFEELLSFFFNTLQHKGICFWKEVLFFKREILTSLRNYFFDFPIHCGRQIDLIKELLSYIFYAL